MNPTPNSGPASDAPRGGTVDLESILFACLDTPEGQRELAFADACKSHPTLAAALRRCWQRIRGLQQSHTAPAQVAGYRIVRRLGSGGMGVVYLAEQEKLGRRVALKLIRSDLLESDQARERFQREALAASRMEHPGLCPVFEVGEADGVPFMVMPYLEGMTLSARLGEVGQADGEHVRAFASSSARRDLVSVVATVARAAHHAHQQGLVHRDIKPGNIMLLPDGRPMLLDFGLARDERLDAPTLTRTGERVGTPAYMAPEQIRAEGLAIDRRTDVYALGIVLYEVVKLATPFASSDLLGLREQILSGIRPGSLRRGVPHDLASIILKAADPDPARRYATAAELADDLDRFSRLEPVRARRLGAVGHSVRWIRRHPVVSGLLFALAVALGLAGAALQSSLRESRAFQSLALQGDSRAAERTDARLAVERALQADELDPTPPSLVQLNRALQCDRELRRWQLDGWVVWLGFSPDRKLLFAVTRIGTFHAFDVASRREVARKPTGFRVDNAVVAPDGSFLVAGAMGKQALLWSLATGELRSLDGAHRGNVWDVAVSADSKTVYTAGNDGVIGRWNAATCKPEEPFKWQTMTSGAARTVHCIGDSVVFGGTKEFTVVRADGSGLVRTRLPRLINRIAWAPEAERFFLCELGVSGLFDTEGRTKPLPGADLIASEAGHMSPCGDRVAIGQTNGTVRVYDLRRAGRGVAGIAEVSYRDCAVGDGPVGPVQFSADGERLFACSSDLSVHVLAANGHPLLRLYGFTKPVEVLDYDPERQLLATGDRAGVVRLWDVRVRRASPPEFQVPGASFSGFATGGIDPVIVRGGDGRIFSFPVDGGEPVLLEGHRGVLDDARVERGGRRLASACYDYTARVWDLATRQPVWSTPAFDYGRPVGVDFLPRDRLLVVLGGNSTRPSEFQVWRIGQTGQEAEATWMGPKGSDRLNHGAAASDGRHVVVASYPGVISIVPVDLAGDPVQFGKPICISHDQPVLHIEFAPGGDRFVAACADNTARIYDLRGQLLATCVGHQKRVEVARFSPSGTRVVTASADGTARIWNAGTGVGEMDVVVGAPSPVWDAQFSADEKVLYTVSMDGVVRGWLLDREKLREAAMAAAGR